MRNALLAIVTFFPYACGWLIGIMVTVILWFVAAIVIGYQTGRGMHRD